MMDTTQAASETEPVIMPQGTTDPDPFGDTPGDPDPGPPKG
ncbi:MAG TPA: hypothetical protein VGX68_15290 [Thermoanaerobaculia bacterium]|jgi:hypothetical protein|nr:hypothetical protein [Thermoanaerobaculia bacterium]